eukprot:gene23522-30493_t
MNIIQIMLLILSFSSCIQIFLSAFVDELKYWTVSNGSTDNIHRFFDSSPFSPSNRFVAYTEFPFSPNSIPPNAATVGRIRIFDTISKNNIAVEDSPIWGSQVGSHVQWGQSDKILYYNSISNPSRNYSFSKPKISGIAFNIVSGERQILDCPIYHISPDGRWGICPNLSTIHRTQRGYGIDSEPIRKSLKLDEGIVSSSKADDGIYLTDLKSGKCRLLVTLQAFIEAAGLSIDSPTFGFHTKWSSDSSRILCVIRTMETAATNLNSWTLSGIWNGLTKTRSQVRVQHLFVVHINNSVSQCLRQKNSHHDGEYKVHYILSWASQSFSFRRNKNSAVRVINLPDGNHPNWVANTHVISMNLEIHQKKDRSHYFGAHEPKIIPLSLWRKYINTSEHHPDDQFLPRLISQVMGDHGKMFKERNCELTLIEVFPIGTGHPHFHSGGRYLFLDAYAKERDVVIAHAATPHHGSPAPLLLADKIPLKIVDILLQREVWLMQVRLAASSGSSTTQERAWRCDMHPVLSLDGQWLAFNARGDPGLAQSVERKALNLVVVGSSPTEISFVSK